MSVPYAHGIATVLPWGKSVEYFFAPVTWKQWEHLWKIPRYMTDHSCNFDYCDVYEDFHSMEEVVTEHLRKSSM